MITLYSTHCPKCNVLSKKMDMLGIKYNVNDNVQEMISKGMKSAPYLQMEDGTLYNFIEANNWLKTLKQ